MKFIFCLFFFVHVYAHAFFPVLKNISDVKSFFPKSKTEVLKVKDDVISNFATTIDEILLDQKKINKQTLQKWDKAFGQIKVYSELLTTLSMVMQSNELRKVCQDAAIEIENSIHKKIMQSQGIYEKLENVKNDKNLNKQDIRYLNNILDYFKSLGLNLNDFERDKIIKLSSELTDLCAKFGANIRDDASYFLAAKSDLKGLSEEFISSLKKTDDGQYIISCDYPTIFPALSKCESANTRKGILKAFYNRAHPENTKILEEIIAKRAEMAKILGYESFANFQLDQRLIKTVSKAENFLYSLLEKIKEKESQEFLALKEFSHHDAEFNDKGLIFPADTHYLWDKYHINKNSLDSDKISEYFSLDMLMEKTVPFLENFYDVKISLSKTNDLWVNNLMVLEVQKNEAKIGFIVLDFFPRKGKYTHACMCPIIPAYNGKKQYPALNVVITNFPSPTSEKPSLLNIQQVRTLYHELGHAFHDILGRTSYVCTSGTNVPIDFVEMPSQLMEEWLFEKEHLKDVSCHYQDNIQLDDEILNHILEARKSDIATQLQRQIFLSLLSLEYFKNNDEVDTSKTYQTLFELCHPNYVFCPEHNFQASFGHLDGYGATYYGYLWSKVIAIDIFESFKENNIIQHGRIKDYVDQIISKGNSIDLIQAVEAYLEREISLDSFLKRLSINDME
jgi:thimet oligopeptidase